MEMIEPEPFSEDVSIHELRKITFTPFDAVLARAVEKKSSLWQLEHGYSDSINFDWILQSTGITEGNVNALNSRKIANASVVDADTIEDGKKIVFLNQKYFAFENAAKEDKLHDESIPAEPQSEFMQDLLKFSTIYDRSDSSELSGEEIDSLPKLKIEESVKLEKPTKSKNKNKNKNKSRKRAEKQQVHIDIEPSTSQSSSSTILAPPGVKIERSRQYRVDLLQCTNNAPQFRL